MLQSIRDRLIGWVAWAFVLVIGIPFAILGVTDFGSPARTLAVAEVNDEVVDQQDYQERFQIRRRGMQQQLGANYRPDKFDSIIQQQVIEEMVEEKLLEKLADENNINVGDEELSSIIKRDPGFSKDGKFDFEVYKNRIAQLGFTPTNYEQTLKNDRALTTIPRMLRASSFVTNQEIRRFHRLANQKRKIDYIELSSKQVGKVVDLSTSELQSFYEQNADQFVRPEQVKLEYIRLSAQQLASRVEVTEEAIRRFYQENADRYIVEEQRQASHILVSLPEGQTLEGSPEVSQKVKDIQSRLNAGEKFEELAREYSEDVGSAENGGSLGQVIRGEMVPPFENALFAMQRVGEVSAPVQSSFGIHLIRLDGITPKQTKSYEMVKDQLRESYANEEAVNLFYDISEQMAVLAHENPDSLAAVSEAIGVPVKSIDWTSRKGGDFGVAANQNVLKEAFSETMRTSNSNSDPIEIGANDAVVFRVTDYRAATRLPFEEARADVMVAAARDAQARKLQAYADTLINRIRGGESLQAISDKEKLELNAAVVLGRQSRDAPVGLVRHVFKMPIPVASSPVIETASLGAGKLAIVLLHEAVDPPGKAQGVQARSLNSRIASRDAGDLMQNLRQNAQVTIHKDKL